MNAFCSSQALDFVNFRKILFFTSCFNGILLYIASLVFTHVGTQDSILWLCSTHCFPHCSRKLTKFETFGAQHVVGIWARVVSTVIVVDGTSIDAYTLMQLLPPQNVHFVFAHGLLMASWVVCLYVALYVAVNRGGDHRL